MNIFLLDKKIYKFLYLFSTLLIYFWGNNFSTLYLVIIAFAYAISDLKFFEKQYDKKIYINKLILILFFITLNDSLFKIFKLNYYINQNISLNSFINILIILIFSILSNKYNKNYYTIN